MVLRAFQSETGLRSRLPLNRRKSIQCFSLIEVIAVLAIGLILATIIATTTVRSIDQVVKNQETQALERFATALQNGILRNRYVPDATDWYLKVAAELGAGTNYVLYNIRNPNSPRVLMVDPALHIGPATVANGVLRYTQGPGGSTNPVSPRLMIVSCLQPETPLPASGIAPANFSPLWNTPAGSLPTNGTFASIRSGEDLVVQRIQLASLFVNLQLLNYPTPAANLGQFSVDGGTTNTVPNDAIGVNAYFIQNTQLSLLKDTNGASAGTVDSNLILNRDATYYYVDRVWRNIPFVPSAFGVNLTNGAALTLAQMISAAASMFVTSPYNVNATAGVTPPVVLNDMSNFMNQYYLYTHYGTNQTVAKAWQTTLGNDMQNLFNGITQGGCTNPPTF